MVETLSGEACKIQQETSLRLPRLKTEGTVMPAALQRVKDKELRTATILRGELWNF